MSVVKGIFYTSLVILILTLLFWGVYNLSFPKSSPEKKQAETETETKKEDSSDIIPPKKEAKIQALSDESVLSPIVTPQDLLRYYSRSTGKPAETNLDGQNKKSIFGEDILGISNVFWSKDGEKSIVQYSSGSETKFVLFDHQKNSRAELKKNLDEVSWQESGNRIFYKYYSPETKERSLNVADPDGTNWKKLTDLSYKNVSIFGIPKTSLVSFWDKPDSFTATVFETVPIIGGEKKTLFKDRFGADYLWGNTGNYFLVSFVDQRGGSKMQLGVANSSGGEYRGLNFATFSSKCAWSKNDKFIFCALPGGIPETAVLPNEYTEGKFTTVDTFWKINPQNGEKERIVETEEISQKFDATDLVLNSDESYLFFINKIDGKLYRISL